MTNQDPANTNDPADQPAAQPAATPPAKSDRKAKLVFGLILLVAVVCVYSLQRTDPKMPGWGEHLSVALDQSAEENRRVLIFFANSPMGVTERKNIKRICGKSGNRKAIIDGNFIPVKVSLESLSSEIADRYKVGKLPTLMIISPAGKELNRHEGEIGEVAFRNGFLDLSKIETPESQ